MDWRQDFNSNEEYWTRHLEPAMSRSKPLSVDLVRPTFWLAARLKARDWLGRVSLFSERNASIQRTPGLTSSR